MIIERKPVGKIFENFHLLEYRYVRIMYANLHISVRMYSLPKLNMHWTIASSYNYRKIMTK